MKKLTAFFLAMLMVFTLAACSGNNSDTGADASKTDSVVDSGDTDQNQNKESSAPGSSEASNNSQTENTDQPSDGEPADTVKVLVAYFSATHTTQGVAETIAGSLNADLYEITPEQPYTAADLNYNDDKSRSTVEMNDPDARPAISGSVENMEQYDIVFIGYPIWWGEAPRILSTFVESYDFSGKTLIPFCTSGGSGVGSSASNLERLTSGAVWLSGTRLNGGATRSSVVEWINGLGLDITAP